ncbi:hypothetical protein Rhe02_53700 [Rhizocola hellebori]|uniref:Uncharacterized protein n=1 Tax=Rhizocola hellebori TaxID=1392758 RepID=A0A8J3VIU8_9ACTN|nr:hypothetical protein [Rhizocola hellebori]GIH07303.1 hypothetical protein Rhe02_53700 [Rhizocola hellebori]
MTENHAAVEAALEHMIAAARAHLTAVQEAKGEVDSDEVWQAYVAFNNSAVAYDELLSANYGEPLPWEVEPIDPDKADKFVTDLVAAEGGVDDPHPRVVSVRQRRDYHIPSVSALLKAAEMARKEVAVDGSDEPITTVADALLELLQTSDGSLAALDIPELEPLDGIVTVAEVDEALEPDSYAEADVNGPYVLSSTDKLVARLDEHLTGDIFEDED